MFVKIKCEYDGKQNVVTININEIVSIEEDNNDYFLDMSNGTCYCVSHNEFKPILDCMRKQDLMFNCGFDYQECEVKKDVC